MRFFRFIVAAALVMTACAAQAGNVFDFTYSGDSFGNTASATGSITIDTTVLDSVNYNDNTGVFLGGAANPFVSALNITITGASSGNGTYTLADFDDVVLWENSATPLDFTKELVGQATSGDPWGTPNGNGGDFNLFNFSGNTDAPHGTFYFTLTTDQGLEDSMLLTSFRPGANAVPESSGAELASVIGLIGTGLAMRTVRRRRA